MNVLPVIMAGGSGTRLWPLSRGSYPKQFLRIDNNEFTLFQETLNRLKGLNTLPPIIICSEDHRFIVAEQLRLINHLDATIILESEGKNTAPAIALAAFNEINKNNDAIMLVLAADHLIADVDSFHASISSASRLAELDKLVAFGISPDKPETGYGYIKKGEVIEKGYLIEQFVEKPDLITAEKYIESGQYLWNSGMFMFKASQYIKELKKHSFGIYEACQLAVQKSILDGLFLRINSEEFGKCDSDSIDYAIMEKTEHSVMVALDAAWNDVGSWSAIWDVSSKDKDENVIKGDVIHIDTYDSYIESSSRLVSTLGVKNLIIVETKDAILVANKERVQDVKKIVEKIKSSNRDEHLSHREVLRPWGCYDSVDSGDRYQVKRITVKPGAKLSVQMHHHRAEHWIVVKGTAKITKGKESYLLTENQSTYIPIGEVHALENPGKITLELIEVQSGNYLGEDDIVRFEDRYGRADV